MLWMLAQPLIAGLLLASILTTLIAVGFVLFNIKRYTPQHHARSSVQILVLGDIGRSPRMQYHALSIAKHGGMVSLVGYNESTPHPAILSNPLITIYPLEPPPALLHSKSLPFIIAGPVKVVCQVATLCHVLGRTAPPAKWLVVQNPPAIPTLLVAGIICRLRNTKLLIDWHNYGWTILAGTRGPAHPFVRISKLYECLLGRWAPTANLTVTRAMAKQLQKPPYSIRAPVLTMHDRPAAMFQPLDVGATGRSRRLEFLRRVEVTAAHADAIVRGDMRLVVSSTSWTPDEDFSLLLSALVLYASSVETSGPNSLALPPLLAVITGKGPLKSYYVDKVTGLTKAGRLPNVILQTAWLPMLDYAQLLACADLGVCLHMSSSGVDLPMKVVDMFGAGLPVAAYSGYESVGELVKEGVNGYGFETAEELAGVLRKLCVHSPHHGKDNEELIRLRKGAVEEGKLRWDDEWDGVVGRVLGLENDGPRPMVY